MSSPTLDTIEAAIDRLSLSDQLLLMEHLASRIRLRTVQRPTMDEHDLAAMASDPAMRHELRVIEDEFSIAEADGLGRV